MGPPGPAGPQGPAGPAGSGLSCHNQLALYWDNPYSELDSSCAGTVVYASNPRSPVDVPVPPTPGGTAPGIRIAIRNIGTADDTALPFDFSINNQAAGAPPPAGWAIGPNVNPDTRVGPPDECLFAHSVFVLPPPATTPPPASRPALKGGASCYVSLSHGTPAPASIVLNILAGTTTRLSITLNPL